MNLKKTLSTTAYEQCYKQFFKQHKKKMQQVGYRIIQQEQLNKQDRDQVFYKIFQRKFKRLLVMKHGYKIGSLQIQQQDLALYCLSLLQAQAVFPIRIFTFDYELTQNSKSKSRRDVWMQTQISKKGLTSNNVNELKYQTRINSFFIQLKQNVQNFLKKRVNWDYMITEEYTDEKVLLEFQHEIIEPTNFKFCQLFP